jgi:hypothetical protein
LPNCAEGPIIFASPRILTRALLSFWAIWFSIVLASNVADGLREAGLLPPGWRFTSGNFALVADSLAIYSLSRTWAAVLFALVLVLELTATSLFWRAALAPQLRSADAKSKIRQAFIAAIGLICGFLLFDEVLVVYRRVPTLAATHFVILCALLLSFLVKCGEQADQQ